MDTVAVIMSTYNGEKYLREQLDSIISQVGVNVKLIIRDDGSNDSTRLILNYYQAKYSNIDVIEGENIGCKGSFYECARYAFEKYLEIQYFAFSDQDDVWLPKKLFKGIEQINNKNIAQLYFCQPKIVDQNLNILQEKWNNNHYLTFGEACICQPCAGCCMVFNRKSLELFLLGDYEEMSMHDSWMYKAVLACGGKIIEDSNSYMLYRQHGNNVIGTQTIRQRWKRRYKNFRSKNCYRSNQIRRIYSKYSNIMPVHIKEKCLKISDYNKNGILGKYNIISDKDLRSKSFLHNFLFAIAILFGRY